MFFWNEDSLRLIEIHNDIIALRNRMNKENKKETSGDEELKDLLKNLIVICLDLTKKLDKLSEKPKPKPRKPSEKKKLS